MAQERQEHSQRSSSERSNNAFDMKSESERVQADERETTGPYFSAKKAAGKAKDAAAEAAATSREMLDEMTEYAKQHPLIALGAAGAAAGLAFGVGRKLFESNSSSIDSSSIHSSAQQLLDSLRRQVSDAPGSEDLRRYAEAGYEMGAKKLKESVGAHPFTATGILLGIGYLLGSACARTKQS